MIQLLSWYNFACGNIIVLCNDANKSIAGIGELNNWEGNKHFHKAGNFQWNERSNWPRRNIILQSKLGEYYRPLTILLIEALYSQAPHNHTCSLYLGNHGCKLPTFCHTAVKLLDSTVKSRPILKCLWYIHQLSIRLHGVWYNVGQWASTSNNSRYFGGSFQNNTMICRAHHAWMTNRWCSLSYMTLASSSRWYYVFPVAYPRGIG